MNEQVQLPSISFHPYFYLILILIFLLLYFLVLSHEKVVTPAESSAASVNLRAHPIFNKGI
jgi:hypothetical protein